jgi:ribosomal protein L29
MTKAKDLRPQSNEELSALIAERQKAMYQLRCRMANKDKDVKPHQIKECRKDIARAKTILGQRK